MSEDFTLSVADIQRATDLGLNRLRRLFTNAPPSIPAPSMKRGISPRLYRLSDVLPVLRRHRKWSSDMERSLIHFSQCKDS